MKEEINELIRKHLPQQVGEVLRERLIKLEALEESYKKLEKISFTDQQKINRLTETNQKLRSDLDKAGCLKRREEEVFLRERNQKIYELQIKLEASNKINEDYQHFINSLMRNTEYREKVYKDFTEESRYDANNNYYTEKVETGYDKIVKKE